MVMLVASRSRIIVEIHVQFVSRVDMDSVSESYPKAPVEVSNLSPIISPAW